MKRRLTTVLIGAGILCFGLSAIAQSGGQYKARLATVPIDFVNAAMITGSGSATADLTGTKLTITGTFTGLRSPATVARLHNGPKGIRGPALFDLTVSKATSGTISGTVQLTAAQVEDLQKGRIYMEVYAEKAPDGNLWGWLFKK